MLKRKGKRGKDKEDEWGWIVNTLYGQSLNTELRLEAYRTLYPQYIPDSSLGLDGEAISRGKSRLMQLWIINFSNNTIFS